MSGGQRAADTAGSLGSTGSAGSVPSGTTTTGQGPRVHSAGRRSGGQRRERPAVRTADDDRPGVVTTGDRDQLAAHVGVGPHRRERLGGHRRTGAAGLAGGGEGPVEGTAGTVVGRRVVDERPLGHVHDDQRRVQQDREPPARRGDRRALRGAVDGHEDRASRGVGLGVARSSPFLPVSTARRSRWAVDSTTMPTATTAAPTQNGVFGRNASARRPAIHGARPPPRKRTKL